MRTLLLLPLSKRFIAFTAVVLISALLLFDEVELYPSIYVVILLVAFGALAVIGTLDVVQTRHAVLRNYPLTAHIRFILEEIRPEIRQYFLESEKDGTPFSRDQRAIVYQRAKRALDKRPFGTQSDVYAPGYEWLQHSMAPKRARREHFRVDVGGPDCSTPYAASIFNISAMSFGALSPNAIRSLNIGAKKGGFAHDTGEGGLSSYHREHGGDVIWEIGSGYFGCRNGDGTFCADKFAETAQNDQVKMVELKLSQGAKPGHGGVLPGAKVTLEISKTRGVPLGKDCISPSRHSAFATPIELMQFIATLRRLSGGKPAGFKLCIGHRGSSSPSARRCWRPASIPTSSSSTARKAAPARRRWNSSTISACRCARGSISSTTRWSASMPATASGSAPPARSSARSTSPASSRSAPTGATRRAASCSRSAASRRSPATPTAARPACRPRIPRASARSSFPTNRSLIVHLPTRRTTAPVRGGLATTFLKTMLFTRRPLGRRNPGLSPPSPPDNYAGAVRPSATTVRV